MLLKYLQILVASFMLLPSFLRRRKDKNFKNILFDNYSFDSPKNLLNCLLLSAVLLSDSIFNGYHSKQNKENIFSKNLPILKDKLFGKSHLPFFELNSQPIRINALVVDNNFDPNVVFGSKRSKLYKKDFTATDGQNSENAPSNSLELTNSRKSTSPGLDINYIHEYDKKNQSSYGNKSPFSDTQSINDYIDEALNNGDFDLDKFACNEKDMCDNLFSSLDEVERSNYRYEHYPTQQENFLTSEFEIIAREMQNNPLDPLSSHFDPYMYDMKMTPKKMDISSNQRKRKGQSSSESLSLFGTTKVNKKKVTRKENSVPTDIPGDMSLRPELAQEGFHQFQRPSSTEIEFDDNENNDGKKKAGRVSKDNELLIENKINITPGELRDFTLKQFKTFLDDNNLSDEQKALCRNIRRRGRNKIAAKKVRNNRLTKNKQSDDSTFETFTMSPTLFLNDPEPTPTRYIRKSQSYNYLEYEFSDDILDKADPLYQIHDVKK